MYDLFEDLFDDIVDDNDKKILLNVYSSYKYLRFLRNNILELEHLYNQEFYYKNFDKYSEKMDELNITYKNEDISHLTKIHSIEYEKINDCMIFLCKYVFKFFRNMNKKKETVKELLSFVDDIEEKDYPLLLDDVFDSFSRAYRDNSNCVEIDDEIEKEEKNLYEYELGKLNFDSVYNSKKSVSHVNIKVGRTKYPTIDVVYKEEENKE